MFQQAHLHSMIQIHIAGYDKNNIQLRPSSGTDIYPHMPILRPHAMQFHEWPITSMTFTLAHLYGNVYMQVGMAHALTDSSDFGPLGIT